MKITAVTAEYNPFHTGHAYHLKKARELTSSDYCIAIMSPDFVQRGEPALVSKYCRTQMALSGGADLVLELPVRYAVSSAQDFARGSIEIMNRLGCVDYISFGCEAEDTGILDTLAAFLADETDSYRSALKDYLRSGQNFPSAREKALLDTASSLPDGQRIEQALQEGLLQKPNNILALAYLQALQETKSTITAIPVRRSGAGYHSVLPDRFASAEAIRSFIKSSPHPAVDLTKIASYIPEECFSFLCQALEHQPLVSYDLYSAVMRCRLLTCEDPSDYEDISGDLARRIRHTLMNYTDLSSFADLLKTRQYTRTRIDRALLHIFLGIRQSSSRCMPSYVRILGFRKSSQPLLHRITQTCSIPVITRPASARSILNPEAFRFFEQDILASHLYQSICGKGSELLTSEYKHSPVMLP